MILEKQNLQLNNVLSLRNKMDQEQINKVLSYLNNYLNENDIERGCFITTTYSIEDIGGKQILDFEILCPVKKISQLPKDFIIKPIFKLTNALKLSHYGNPQMLQDSIQQLISYSNSKRYTPITPLYNVTVKEPGSSNVMEKFQIDLYLGITENIL